MTVAAYGDIDAFETARPIRDDDYSVGLVSVEVAPPAESGPLGACWMICWHRFEEDDETVNWGSLSGVGYRHWRCR